MGLDRRLIISKAEEYFEIASEERYQKEEPNQLQRLPTAFENGTWDWEDLEWIVRWKSPRPIKHFQSNDRDTVDDLIAKVVEAGSTQRKLDLLTDLSGVRVKMASAFLLFMDPKRYTVIDSRAGSVLTREGYIPSNPDDPSIEEYINYLDVCRGLADEYEVELRTLDRALWVLGGSN